MGQPGAAARGAHGGALSGDGRARATGRRTLLVLFLATLPLVTPKIRGADEIECFSYLRSAVFDQDFEFGNEYQHFYDQDARGLAGFKATFLDRQEPRTGRHINFASLGSALLWSPFYLLAHAGVLAARALGAGVAADGFSSPYLAAACYASALYGFLGLWLVYDSLRRFTSLGEPALTWAVASLWLGTPVLYYMTLAPGFSHACSLFAVALMLWLWLRAGDSALTPHPAPPHVGGGNRCGENGSETSAIDWALIGAAGGLAGLVREQDLLFLAAPAGHLVWETIKRREWSVGLGRALALGAAAALAFTPQLLAYHAVNGTYGPSRMVARKMTYSSPHFLSVLFDPGHGLFAWSPLLLVATVGLAVAAARTRQRTLVLMAVTLLLQVWINGSVESWTQAGAFGSRRFISATPVLAWGLASLLAGSLPRLGRTAWAAMLTLFVWWNMSLMVQFGLRLMDRQGLEWPRVAVSQVTEVPPRLGRAAFLFFTDRERLGKQGP